MKTIADMLGSVMTAVRLPRKTPGLMHINHNLETYVKTEFSKGDQAYVLDCMLRGDTLDRRNIV
ncbi:hypothetical protein OAP94_01765 [bacterium]|nr:hypothetical protein [bacterium]MDC1007389.1 hypothetical protein [bacterium]